MNSTTVKYLASCLAITLLAACSNPSATPPADRQARLKELKEQHATITKEIQGLEAELAKENPIAVAVRSKEVVAEEVQPRSFDHFIQTQGRVVAEENILVSAKMAGPIIAVYVKVGEQVNKGQVMAQIDNAIILRSIDGLKPQLELARSVYERQRKLWEQKIGSEVQYLSAKSNKEALEEQMNTLKEQLDMTRIKAPIAGTVDMVVAKTGENTAPGAPAFRVVNTSQMVLQARLSEAYANTIHLKDKAIVKLADNKTEIQSVVTFAGQTIDPLSRTFDVEIKLPSMKEAHPNMSAIVRIVYFTEDSAIVVPMNVVQNINDQKVVYVAESQGDRMVARRKLVEVVGVFDNQAQVKGLTAGEKVITVGFQGLNDGDFVTN